MHTSGSPQLCFLGTDEFERSVSEIPLIRARLASGRPYLLCFTAATRSGPENMEKRLSPFAEDVSSLELAESPWFADQLLLMASLNAR